MKLLSLLLAIAVLSGCTTTSKMNVADLNHYQIDCNNREEQLTFLKQQFPNGKDRLVNAMRVTSPGGILLSVHDGTYQEERAIFDRKQQAIARVIIREIEMYCPVQPKVQGCLHLDETFPAGSSQGAKCYQNGSAKPVVSRWEVIDR